MAEVFELLLYSVLFQSFFTNRNPNPFRIRYQRSTSNPNLVWHRLNISQTNNQ